MNVGSTQLVPCKFFKAGTCTAGKSCQFAHIKEEKSVAVCPYYYKGTCKYGKSCALSHTGPTGFFFFSSFVGKKQINQIIFIKKRLIYINQVKVKVNFQLFHHLSNNQFLKMNLPQWKSFLWRKMKLKTQL